MNVYSKHMNSKYIYMFMMYMYNSYNRVYIYIIYTRREPSKYIQNFIGFCVQLFCVYIYIQLYIYILLFCFNPPEE